MGCRCAIAWHANPWSDTTVRVPQSAIFCVTLSARDKGLYYKWSIHNLQTFANRRGYSSNMKSWTSSSRRAAAYSGASMPWADMRNSPPKISIVQQTFDSKAVSSTDSDLLATESFSSSTVLTGSLSMRTQIDQKTILWMFLMQKRKHATFKNSIRCK